jgi:2-polyprenyl-3-methyl-5-hydroxy-6-metoxy-1,4-benzoquinol methylase
MRVDKANVDRIAAEYAPEGGFDRIGTRLASRIINPLCAGRDVLEVGCAYGEMTADLADVARSVTVAEPSATFCDIVARRLGPRVRVLNAFLEELDGTTRYDVIVVASLLHHLVDPSAFLRHAKRLLRPGGMVLATVPNMTSLHRRVGVKAGLIADVADTTERNAQLQQPGRFVKASLEAVFNQSGYDVVESYGFMLKPFSNAQMESLNLEWPVIDALFEIGKEFPDLAAHLFVRAV